MIKGVKKQAFKAGLRRGRGAEKRKVGKRMKRRGQKLRQRRK